MNSAAIGVALTAGMIAAFNPCGFALLPAYLALFLGDRAEAGSGGSVVKALGVGASVTAGFVFVFGVAGILISALAVNVGAVTPYVTIIVGPLLALLGVWLLLGRELLIRLPRWSTSVDPGVPGMFVYGIIYATVSLSCTIPVFLVAVVGAFRADSFGAGVAVLLAYAAGMGIVLTSLAVALALARDRLVVRSRLFLPYVSRASGLLLLLAGLYITWYGYVELRILSGDVVSRGPVEWVATWSGHVSTAIEAHKSLVVWAALMVLAAGSVALVLRHRRSMTTSPSEDVTAYARSGKDSV